MGVTVTNLLQGPGTLYQGTYSETAANEPANTAINIAPAASAWTDLGATKDGMSLEVAREFSELEVDQIIDTPDRRQTKREFTFATNLAEATLENLARVSNEDHTTAVTSGAGYKEYSPDHNPYMPRYSALIFDGYAPAGFRRRVFGRRMLAVDNITIAYKKADQTTYTAKWAGHYVSEAVRPYKIVDQIS
jgi:hypothetical protein